MAISIPMLLSILSSGASLASHFSGNKGNQATNQIQQQGNGGMLPLKTNEVGGSSFFGGGSDRMVQAPTVTGEQQQGLSQILAQALGGIQNPTQGFEPIAQQARTQFDQQTIPSIMERLTGMGVQRSSGLAQQLGAAGAGLDQSLSAQKAQFGQQALGPLLQMLQLGTRPQFENAYIPGQQGLFGGFGSGLAGGLGKAAGTYAGSPEGMKKIMEALSSLLSRLGGSK